ncbi:cation:proton antiporter [Marinobacteraceae bacterium S3BR75-40.1]
MTDLIALIHAEPFYELGALLALAALVGFIGQRLKQPMIVSFIAVGLIAGPSVLDIVQSEKTIQPLAELGIAVLLFLVGLKLDLKLVRTLGLVSLATGLGQVLFTSLFGFFIGLALDMDVITSLYVAVALTFSSTIIIVKLLTDKKEVDALHGRIALGFLIVQDLVVVLAMMVLSAWGIGAESQASMPSYLLALCLEITGIFLLIALFMRYVASPLLERIAHSSELLVVFAIAWAALLAALGDLLGFSKELGGLLAGVSLASTSYREALFSRLASLRDFLLLFFFIALGMHLDLSLLGAQVGAAILFSAFVLIGNPLIVMVIMGIMGFRKRTGFLAGLTVAQISEFSLIFITMGVYLGHVDTPALGLVTLVGLVTIALSVYMISYSNRLYQMLEPALGIFERKYPFREQSPDAPATRHRHEVILVGTGRYGTAIARCLDQAGYRMLVVDFDPDKVRRWRKSGGDAIYGDASDQEFISMLPMQGVQWVISALPHQEMSLTHEDPRLVLIKGLRHQGFKGRIAVSAHPGDDAFALKKAGADLVLSPYQDAAKYLVKKIQRKGDRNAGPSREGVIDL